MKPALLILIAAVFALGLASAVQAPSPVENSSLLVPGVRDGESATYGGNLQAFLTFRASVPRIAADGTVEFGPTVRIEHQDVFYNHLDSTSLIPIVREFLCVVRDGESGCQPWSEWDWRMAGCPMTDGTFLAGLTLHAGDQFEIVECGLTGANLSVAITGPLPSSPEGTKLVAHIPSRGNFGALLLHLDERSVFPLALEGEGELSVRTALEQGTGEPWYVTRPYSPPAPALPALPFDAGYPQEGAPPHGFVSWAEARAAFPVETEVSEDRSLRSLTYYPGADLRVGLYASPLRTDSWDAAFHEEEGVAWRFERSSAGSQPTLPNELPPLALWSKAEIAPPDGSPHNVTCDHSVRVWDAVSAVAVRQYLEGLGAWRYEPAPCGDHVLRVFGTRYAGWAMFPEHVDVDASTGLFNQAFFPDSLGNR